MRISRIIPSAAPTLSDAKQNKLFQITAWTASAITGGFVSSAMGGKYRYDSEEADQQNLMLMRQVSASPDFSTNKIYQGKIPLRAIPAGASEKVILMHDAGQIQKVVDDLALHIGSCKQRGWELQAAVDVADTIDAVEKIKW